MSADHQAHGLSIADAARHLGVSENAVRQRIKRGTVNASKVDGVWRVTLGEAYQGADHEVDYQPDPEARPLGDHEQRLSGDYQATSQPTVSVSARAQLAVLVEEMLAPIITQHEERTTDLARRLGRSEAERDHVLQELSAARLERDVLHAELERLREVETAHAPVDTQEAPGHVDVPPMDDLTWIRVPSEPVPSQMSLATSWRRWWRRLLGQEGG